MVDCSQFLDEYSDFRDGLLCESRLRSFQSHLDACGSCARYDRVMEEGLRVFRDLPPVEPSYDFVPRLQHRLYHLEEEMRRPAPHASGASIVFTLAIATVIGVSAWMPAMRNRTEIVRLPPVAAHAPHRPEPVRVLYPAPFALPEPLLPFTAATAPSLLFYQYPSHHPQLGAYTVQSATWSAPN